MGEIAYLLANASVAPVWGLMILAPHAGITERITRTPLFPALYAVVYAGLFLATQFAPGEGGMLSLDDLRLAFERDAVLIMAWIHYLAFDMAVGMWVFRDARRLELSWFAVAPCLFLTLMAGPFGFLAYLGLRWFKAGVAAWDPPVSR